MMIILKTLLFLSVIVLPLTACRESRITKPPKDNSGLFRIKQNSKWGFMDRTGKVVINPQFDGAYDFSDGLACVKAGNRYGFIDTKGQYAINPQFETTDRPDWPCRGFSEGVAPIRLSRNRTVYIDRTGKTVIDAQSSSEYFSSGATQNPFSEGLAPILQRPSAGGNCGYVDKTGKTVISPQFVICNDFAEGLAAVAIGAGTNYKYGYIDTAGTVVVSPQFDESKPFSEGLAVVRVGRKFGYIDRTGKLIINPQFDEADGFSEGLACVGIGDYPTKKFGFIDKTGKYVINPEFEAAGDYAHAGGFSEGLAAAKTEGKWGYIDKTGKFTISPQFMEAEMFSGGLAAVGIRDTIDGYKSGSWERFGYIDSTGKYVWNIQN